MNHTRTPRPRLVAWGAIVLSALLGVALATVPAAGALGTTPHAHPEAAAVSTPRVARSDFQDQMRKLWEDHITWTRLSIVTFADESPGFGATADRLLQNQSDIGDAIAPFYGRAAGDQLTAMLRDHITIAVELLSAVRAEDTEAFDGARTRWYANGNDIADFLSAANPRSWPDDLMRADMKQHLDQTLAQVAHELNAECTASVADYEVLHTHILMMADRLSDGIIAQFPSRFR